MSAISYEFGENPAADAGIVQESVDALVAAHGDMRDGVDPKPWRVTATDAAIEQVDLWRNVGKERIERFVEEFKTGNFRVMQIDDDAGAFRRLDARLMHRLLQRRVRFTLACRRSGFAFATPHRPSRPRANPHA